MTKKTFHSEPYFDDFDQTKGFHKILFVPKGAVQARELNQMQSIIDNQIEQFGDHIFKHGSIVTGTTPNYTPNVAYVRLKEYANGDLTDLVNIAKLENRQLKGRTSAITAKVINQVGATDTDPDTLYIQYGNSGGETGEIKEFLDGETIDVLDDFGNSYYSVEVRCPTCPEFPSTETITPTGRGSLFNITSGVYYIFGYFVYVEEQVIILDKYETSPSYDVGLEIQQSIVTANDDVSLLDNALGYPNHTSQGADRYKIQLKLSKRPIESELQDNFVLVARVSYGILNEIKDKPEYAVIEDMIARRTYDESGDYTVTPFLISFKEMLKSAPDRNDGLYYPEGDPEPEELANLESKFAAVFTQGKAYVQGREIEKIANSFVEMDKARDVATVETSAMRTVQGNYFYMTLGKNVSGDVISSVFPLSNITENTSSAVDFEEIQLRDGVINSGTPSGAVIGHARVKSQEKYALPSGHPITDTVYKIHLFDIEFTGTNTFADVKGIYKDGQDKFFGDPITDENIFIGSGVSVPKIYSPSANNLLMELPYKFTKKVSNTEIIIRKKFIGTSNSSGEFNFGTNGDEFFQQFNTQRWLMGIEDSTLISYVPVALNSANTTILNPQSARVTGLTPNKPCVLICDVRKTNVTAKEKTIEEKLLSTPLTVSGQYDWIQLDVTDAWKIVSVMDVTVPESPIDITDEFELDRAIFDNYYSISKIRQLPSVPALQANIDIEIVVQYLDHVGAGGGFFYSPNSYQTLIADPNNDFGYEDIPSYTASNGTVYELRSCLDFRPDQVNPNNVGNEFEETPFIPARDTNIIFDIEFYLPRIDKIVLTELGDFQVVKGVSSLNPQAPKIPINTMNLYEIELDAYTFDIKSDLAAKYVDNRRFTMRDIGKIEKRVDNLEYYSSFNQLEKSTESLSIKDANGVDRFKNGFITDNFVNFTATDTAHPEFNAALDTTNRELRPSFVAKNVRLDLDEENSSNVTVHGNVVTSNYVEGVYVNQPQASKSISVNPYFIFNWVGQLTLSPDVDAWKDVSTKPDLVVNINTGFEGVNNSNSNGNAMNNLWGSWNSNNGVSSSTGSVRRTVVGSSIGSNTTGAGTTVTNTNRIRTDRTVLSTRIERSQNNLGERITDVNIIPYIREAEVDFVASALRPNTRVYPFFDDIDVTEFCRPLNGRNGDALVTDEDGQLLGKFNIPNNDKIRFKVGDRVFKLLDSATNSNDADEVTSSASAKYWAGGVSADKQSTRLNTARAITTSRVVSSFSSESSSSFVPTPPVPAPVVNVTNVTNVTNISTPRPAVVAIKPAPLPVQPPRRVPVVPPRWTNPWGGGDGGGGGEGDPLAQDFTITEKNGVFLTKISIYFEAKGESKPVWLEIREMQNGYPAEDLLPYSHVIKFPKDINVSTDSNTATEFEFEAPVFLKGGGNYCFVVGSDDLENRLWVARLGGRTIDTNNLITAQPTLGTMFKSQNNRTWNAEQLEDIKFILHQAKFDRNEMVVKYKNGFYDSEFLEVDPFETEVGSNLVRVYHKNHGLIANDKVKFEMYTDITVPLTITSGDLIIGQKVTAVNGQGNARIKNAIFIEEVTDATGTYKKYNVLLSDLTGEFPPNTEFVADDFIETVENNFILKRLGIDTDRVTQNAASLSSSVGKWDLGISTSLNGIALARISEKEHIVQTVDSSDSYVIQLTGVNSTANETGRVGSTGVRARGNIQVDAFQLTGQYDLHDSALDWDVGGIYHSGVGSKFVGTDYESTEIVQFTDNELIELERPWKVANATNELAKVVDVGRHSLDVTGRFSAIEVDNNVSPVSYLASVSMTTITNRVDFNTCLNYSVEPNQTTDGLALVCDIDDVDYNARWVNETDATIGSESSKYIVKKVSLSNPATSLRMFLDVYKTVDSDVLVYYKTLPVESSSSIEEVKWIKAEFDNDVTSEQADEFKEVQVTIGDPELGQTAIPDFKEFRFKIIMKAKNSAKPPRAKNFRAIAVT